MAGILVGWLRSAGWWRCPVYGTDLAENLHRRDEENADVYQESGGDLRLTQELLGHADPSSTAIYTLVDMTKATPVVRNLGRRRVAQRALFGHNARDGTVAGEG